MEISIRNRQRTTKISLLRIKKTVSRVLAHLALKDKALKDCADRLELSVILVNDRVIRNLNRVYRGLDKVTDVLSFPQNSPFCFSKKTALPVHLGDLAISLPRAKKQAVEYGVNFYDELTRLLVHGLLHLLGHDHECGGYKAVKMRKLEREILEGLCR